MIERDFISGLLDTATLGILPMVESATGVVSYIIYEAGEAMDMPAGITFALSIAGGGLTYTSLEGGMIQIKKNSSTKVSEKLLDQFNSMTRNELTSYHYGNTTKITEAFLIFQKLILL